MPALVLALNPSIDHEWFVEQVQWGEKNPVMTERRWAGGKGVNVARWLRHFGQNVRLLLPLGGATGQELARLLQEERLPSTIVRVREASRVNVIVTTRKRLQLRFNPLGPKLSGAEWQNLFHKMEQALLLHEPSAGAQSIALRAAQRSTRGFAVATRAKIGIGASHECVILSGSLPREAPADIYARLIHKARVAGRKVLFDCDGAPFEIGIRSRPFLVKPNVHELSQWHGRSLVAEKEILRAAQKLSRITLGWVMVSRGGTGAILVNAIEKKTFKAIAPKLATLNTVGAGDAMLAAMARQIFLGSPPAEWLRWGVASGTAATQCVAGKLPDAKLIDRLASVIGVVEKRN